SNVSVPGESSVFKAHSRTNMPSHHDCQCKHCSTDIDKRARSHPPQTQPQIHGQTDRVLKISAGDIFPILKIPSRLIKKLPRLTMPTLIRLEKTDTSSQQYERGWNYVETR